MLLEQTGGWTVGNAPDSPSEFRINMHITNLTAQATTNWSLTCELPFTVKDLSTGSVSSQGFEHVFQSSPWAGVIAPQQSISVGFGGVGEIKALISATACTLNDQSVNLQIKPMPFGGPVAIKLPTIEDDVIQLDLPQGQSEIAVFADGYELATNNNQVLDVALVGDKIVITGKQAGRASLRIRLGDKQRFIGIRILNTDGTPPGLPSYLAQGSVSEDIPADMDFWYDFAEKDQGRFLDFRYIYINGGPFEEGWRTSQGAPAGRRAINSIVESLKLGMIPSLIYYNIPAGGESYANDVSNMRNPEYMYGYYSDLKLLGDIIKQYAPNELIQIILEPDFLGYMSQHGEDPLTSMAQVEQAYAAGLLTRGVDPDFPNTITGLVQSINYIIDRDIKHAQFGWKINLWASPTGGYVHSPGSNGIVRLSDGQEMLTARAQLFAETTAIADYYIKAGILSYNANIVAIDKYGYDAVGYESIGATNPSAARWFFNADHWNNYLLFANAIHQRTQLPVYLWQLPVGHINSSHAFSPYHTSGKFPDLANSNTKFEDSAPTYFFGDTFTAKSAVHLEYFSENRLNDPKISHQGMQITWGDHMQETVDAGVIGLLWGAGVGMSTDGVGSPPTDDYWWINKVQEYYRNGTTPLN